MSVFWITCLIIIVVLLVLMLIAAQKSDNFSVKRDIVINAPREKIYPLISTMRAWTQWSPWQTKDPDMVQSFGEIAEGIGASMRWSGNSKVGQGQMKIIDAKIPSDITILLNFEKPFKAKNTGNFTLREGNGVTVVVWTMTGKANLISKIMDTLMDMDKMIGRDFEQGLANLKAISET